jgi:hypothetical protein
MTQERWLELPEHVVAKIQEVLGIAPSALPEHDLVSLIEELCDTALMFDREERGADRGEKEETPSGATPGVAATQPSKCPPVVGSQGVEGGVFGAESLANNE